MLLILGLGKMIIFGSDINESKCPFFTYMYASVDQKDVNVSPWSSNKGCFFSTLCRLTFERQ